MHTQFGLVHFWQQADFVAQSVALLLLLLSVACWSLTVARFVQQMRFNRAVEQAPQAFWQANNLAEGLRAVENADRTGIFAGLARAGMRVADLHTCPAKGTGANNVACDACQQQDSCHAARGLEAGVSLNESLTRALRNHILHTQAGMESGLTFLASVGATAPFIGLFGTVWGIYHALVSLSGATSVVLDKVAGPVGEALIMTAAGLFVAIPAVLAYNALVRANRLVLAQLDGFAHDLHAYLTTGARQVVHTQTAPRGAPTVAMAGGAV